MSSTCGLEAGCTNRRRASQREAGGSGGRDARSCLRLAPGANSGAQRSNEPVISEPQQRGERSSGTVSRPGKKGERNQRKTGFRRRSRRPRQPRWETQRNLRRRRPRRCEPHLACSRPLAPAPARSDGSAAADTPLNGSDQSQRQLRLCSPAPACVSLAGTAWR